MAVVKVYFFRDTAGVLVGPCRNKADAIRADALFVEVVMRPLTPEEARELMHIHFSARKILLEVRRAVTEPA